MTTPRQLLSRIRYVLNRLGGEMNSLAAQQLLLGTAYHESLGFRHRRQIGNGPALSYYQIERATHDDVWNNYLNFPRNRSLAHNVNGFFVPYRDRLYALEHSDYYATAMARIVYYRVPAPMPAFRDVNAMARYWKQHYNRNIVRARHANRFVNSWNQLVSVHGDPFLP